MLEWLIALLEQQSILLLFAVAAVGHFIGKQSIKGISFGVSAVLFTGLIVSALNQKLVLPSVFGTLGLVVFVYSIGISSGPTFINSLRRGGSGRRDNAAVAIYLSLTALLVVGVGLLLHLLPQFTAGLFAGATTNTPALAGVVQTITSGNAPGLSAADGSIPVVAYSLAYPLGVLGPILAIAFWQKRFRINYRKDALLATDTVGVINLNTRTIKITNARYNDVSLKSIMREHRWHVVFGKVRRGDVEWLATSAHRHLEVGDLLTVMGSPEDVLPVIRELGEESHEELDLDLTQYDRHRIIVSSRSVAGRKIRELRLPQRYGAMITRIKRGDMEMLAHKNFVLEYGDRVRVLAPADKTARVRRFLGDSYNDVSKINVVGIGVGISLGIILGSLALTLPGGIVFRLGEAGGPLVVGLFFGVLQRTGKIVWGIPYTANLTLREFGLILMLATIGTRSGQSFASALQSADGLPVFLWAASISLLVPFIFLPILYKKLKLPFAVSTGMLAAAHSQPAIHAYAAQQANNDLPNQGYAVIFPLASILKIIAAQVILLVLLR